MEPNSHKRKADHMEDDSSSSSIEFIKECKKKIQKPAAPKQETRHPTSTSLFTIFPAPVRKLGQNNPERSPKMIPEQKLKTEGRNLESGGINRDEAIQEMQLVVSNCEDRVRDLQEKNEEWKEAIATRAQKETDSYETRLAKVEKEIQLEDVHGLAEKIDDVKREYRDELTLRLGAIPQTLEDVKKECQGEIDVRLQSFANHMMGFFSQNVSPAGTNAYTQTDLSVSYGTEGLKAGPSTEIQSVKSSESKLIGSIQTGASTIVSHVALGLSGASFLKEPCLTNQGYQELMRNFSFQNIHQLEALSKTDRRENLRDCVIFCNIAFPTSWIDYVVRIGGCSSLIMDNTPDVIYKHHPALAHSDLSQLRIFELQLSAAHFTNELEFKQWKDQFSPPKYVYELGQLFVRRQFNKGKKTDIFSSVYNLVMDIAKPEKPVWLVVRPGCVPSLSKNGSKRDKVSSLPFDGMDRCSMARLVDKIGDLSFTRTDFSRNSFGSFIEAEHLVKVTGCKVELTVKSQAADITEMVKTISLR